MILLLIYFVFVTSARFAVLTHEADVEPWMVSGSPVGWGFLLSVGLFASVLLHELGHALTAQNMGVKVRSITLMMLGGVSSMERIPERKYGEFRLAVLGPLVSFALAGLLFLVNGRISDPNWIFFTYWLGSLNLVLGIFNLLPAFPLDGGRALRSLLAARQGMVRATQTSVRISRVFAWALGILGLLTFNILLMLIAFFIYTAAQSELFFMLTRGVLKGMKTGEVAVRADPIGERELIREAVERMLATRTTLLPVRTLDNRATIVGLAQIRRVPRQFWGVTRVTDVMEDAMRPLDSREPIGEALPQLASAPMGTLPVSEDGQVIGYVRYADVSEILQLKSLDESDQKDVDRAA